MLNTILDFLFRRRAPVFAPENEDALRNFSLELAQEWGKNWLQPIQPRLRKIYPTMNQAELDRFDSISRDAMMFAYDLVCSLAEKEGSHNVDKLAWQREVSARYPWIDEKNLRSLFSTGIYYANK